MPTAETSLEAWLRQLTISLWFRTSGKEESLALADEWFNRVQAAIGESLAYFDAHEDSQIERFVSRGVPNSFRVTTRVVPLTTQFSQMRRPSPNLLGGSAYWTVRGVKSIWIKFGWREVPCDEGEHPDGQELLLNCALWSLPDGEREALYDIADHLCLTNDLTYGQVGHATFEATFTDNHPLVLGPNQGWRMRELRGYDWITWIPPRLARQISPDHRADAASHLFEVTEWDTGLLRLRATDRPDTFDEASLRHLFHAVAELLPDGPPIPWEAFPTLTPVSPPMLVYEDARDHR